ncbi:Exocyst complex component Sec8 [Kluyveromyces marxianus]
MDYLQPTTGTRRRALSIRSTTDAEREAMENSVAKLQADISMLGTEWNRIITKDTNPLELALRFLDETSVGLHHRFGEFIELKSRFARDLQEVANDNYQAFNDSVASFSKTVDCITDAQDTLADIKTGVSNSLQKLAIKDETLNDLNEDFMKQSKMISTLTAMEEVIRANEKVEKALMNSDFTEAQEALSLGFTLAKEHDLWDLDVMKNIRDQFTSHELTLFELLLESITDIVYSKRATHVGDDQSMFSGEKTEDTFGSLENYLHHVIHEDISEESYKKNLLLREFLKKLGQAQSDDDEFAVSEETDYDKLFSYMKTLHLMNKLPLALELLQKKSKAEIKNIVTKSVDDMRLKHPSILKITASLQNNNTNNANLGISGQDILSVLIRRLFWDTFIKFLTAVQNHYALYEITKALQPPATSNISYPFVEIWNTIFCVAKDLISNYTKDPALVRNVRQKRRGSSNLLQVKGTSESQIFSLQSNIEKDNNSQLGHANELKSMLTEMFPGFALSTNIDLENIYLTEEKYEADETLVPPSVFNMRMILESLLVFVQGSKDLLPPSLEEKTISATEFFLDLMELDFLPQLSQTMNYLYDTQVESNVPFAVEKFVNGTPILKSAIHFKNLFFTMLQTTNASNFYRNNVASILVSIVEKFYNYYYSIYQSICGTANTVVSKKLISGWLTDKAAGKITSKIFSGDKSFVDAETQRLLEQCPRVFQSQTTLGKSDYFSDATIDTLIHFATTLEWISSWLPDLMKEVKDTEPANIDRRKDVSHTELRSMWSFFEVSEVDLSDKTASLKFLLAGQNMKKFQNVTEKLRNLHYLILQSVRYDVRVRCLYHINQMFYASKWNPEVTSIELDENISSLVSDLSFLHNKLKAAFTAEHSILVFIGISNFMNHALITGSKSITILNVHGAKKLLRNVNALQQACKAATDGGDTEDLSKSISFFTICSLDSENVLEYFQKGELNGLNKEDVKNALRLVFSEELHRQSKRQSGTNHRTISMSASKRLEDAIKKADQFLTSKELD